MSANLKIRTMNTLLLGAALLTPLAAQDRNRNDRNDPRGADQNRFQSQGQRPNAAPPALENRGGAQNRGGNGFRNDDRAGNQYRGAENRSPQFDRRDADRFRGNDRGYVSRGYTNGYRPGFDRGYNRGYYVSRYPARRWSSGEDRAFRIFLAERQLAYLSWDACDPYEQDEYWDWRDAHPDRILFSLSFGRR